MSVTRAELHFVDLRIGEELPPVEHAVTQEVIDRAALAHLDFNPVHTNIEWCRRAQVFQTERTVAHGMFTMSLMASVIDRAWRHAGAAIRGMETKFTKPVPVGQTIRCTGTIKELHPRCPGASFVIVSVIAIDGEGDTVGVGSFRVLVPD